jgi:integrase
MARTAHPWFWEERNGWYVNRNGQRHFLGGHPPDAPVPKKTKGKWNAPDAIRTAFHALMAAPPERAPQRHQNSVPDSVPDQLSVSELFDKYLEWCQKYREKRTYDGYVWHLQKFLDHLGDRATAPALSLRPFHVVEWLDAHPDWGQTYRRNATGAVQRAYNWAEELGHIESNPVRKIKKPLAARREKYVRPEDWVAIRDCYKPADPFRVFLEFCWETGCRPQEARHIEPRHVHPDKAVIAIPPKEAKGRKKWRVIRLEGRALEIVKERLPGAVEKLFTNRDGGAWTSYALNCRFHRLKEKLGERFSPYLFRHGFTQRLLVSGVDHLTVAALLGHADGTMVSKVYSHMDQADDHLREALRKASPAPAPAARSDPAATA